MFTRQAPPLLTNLWQAGLSSAQASAIQNLLGQCRQPLAHNGPVQYDYTKPDMRLITPATATYQYPGTQLPAPEDFPKFPSQPEPIFQPPRRPGSPPTKKVPDPRKVPGRNAPGGFLGPDHIPVEPQQPPGPGEERRFPNQPWGPNAFNGLWFGGDYISVDRANRQINLENNDLRRHAVFPTQLNRKGRVNSVEFVDNPGGNVPEFIRLAIAERPFQTVFSVETTGLQKIRYITGIDTSDPDKIKFERQEAWVFSPSAISDVVLPNCCYCPCDCSELSGTQPNISYSSASCPEVFCPEPSPEVCECPVIEGTLAPADPNEYGNVCAAWADLIPGCYTTDEWGITRTAHLYVTISCAEPGNWDISVVIYKAFGAEGGQVFTGNTNSMLCVKSGKITGTVSGITLSNGLGGSCDIDLTFNP